MSAQNPAVTVGPPVYAVTTSPRRPVADPSAAWAAASERAPEVAVIVQLGGATQLQVRMMVAVPDTLTLWRPTGPEELALVEATGFTRWPPRLPGQPIFYPVMNEDYATRIASDWNVKASGVGYVTRFDVDSTYASRYDVHQVGGASILELWVPADELEQFNDHIVGLIEVVAEFR